MLLQNRLAEESKKKGITNETIFLREDDLSLINGLSFALKKQGYEIEVARTTLEADTLWTDGKYDLAILDVSLPDGSGFDFCRSGNLKNAVTERNSNDINIRLLKGEVYKKGKLPELTASE